MTVAAYLVACPHCDALNRVPAERLAHAPRCGRCHQGLFQGQPLALTAARFDAHAQRADLPLLVDFWAPWCGPCRTMAPQFAASAPLLEPRMRLVKIDTDAEPALGQRFAIRSIPTLVLLQHGRVLARRSGASGSADIVRWASQQLP